MLIYKQMHYIKPNLLDTISHLVSWVTNQITMIPQPHADPRLEYFAKVSKNNIRPLCRKWVLDKVSNRTPVLTSLIKNSHQFLHNITFTPVRALLTARFA